MSDKKLNPEPEATQPEAPEIEAETAPEEKPSPAESSAKDPSAEVEAPGEGEPTDPEKSEGYLDMRRREAEEAARAEVMTKMEKQEDRSEHFAKLLTEADERLDQARGELEKAKAVYAACVEAKDEVIRARDAADGKPEHKKNTESILDHIKTMNQRKRDQAAKQAETVKVIPVSPLSAVDLAMRARARRPGPQLPRS